MVAVTIQFFSDKLPPRAFPFMLAPHPLPRQYLVDFLFFGGARSPPSPSSICASWLIFFRFGATRAYWIHSIVTWHVRLNPVSFFISHSALSLESLHLLRRVISIKNKFLMCFAHKIHQFRNSPIIIAIWPRLSSV